MDGRRLTRPGPRMDPSGGHGRPRARMRGHEHRAVSETRSGGHGSGRWSNAELEVGGRNEEKLRLEIRTELFSPRGRSVQSADVASGS